MLADDAALGGDNFAARFPGGNPLLAEIGVDESGVVAVGNEADLLAIGLCRGWNRELARELADLRFFESAERKQGSRELRLCQSEKKVGLILCSIGAAAHFPTPAVRVPCDLRVMARCNAGRADAVGHFQELIELDEVIAQRAGDGRASGKVLVDEWLHHLPLESIFKIDHVIGNAEMLRDVARVVHIVERAAASGGGSGGDFGKAPLVPELHRES